MVEPRVDRMTEQLGRPVTLKTYPEAEWGEGPVRLCANLTLE